MKEARKRNSSEISGLSGHVDSLLLSLFLLLVLHGLWQMGPLPQVKSSGASGGNLIFSFSKETTMGKKSYLNKIASVAWEIQSVVSF